MPVFFFKKYVTIEKNYVWQFLCPTFSLFSKIYHKSMTFVLSPHFRKLTQKNEIL